MSAWPDPPSLRLRSGSSAGWRPDGGRAPPGSWSAASLRPSCSRRSSRSAAGTPGFPLALAAGGGAAAGCRVHPPRTAPPVRHLSLAGSRGGAGGVPAHPRYRRPVGGGRRGVSARCRLRRHAPGRHRHLRSVAADLPARCRRPHRPSAVPTLRGAGQRVDMVPQRERRRRVHQLRTAGHPDRQLSGAGPPAGGGGLPGKPVHAARRPLPPARAGAADGAVPGGALPAAPRAADRAAGGHPERPGGGLSGRDPARRSRRTAAARHPGLARLHRAHHVYRAVLRAAARPARHGRRLPRLGQRRRGRRSTASLFPARCCIIRGCCSGRASGSRCSAATSASATSAGWTTSGPPRFAINGICCNCSTSIRSSARWCRNCATRGCTTMR